MSIDRNTTLVLNGNDVEIIMKHYGINTVMDTIISRLTHAIQTFNPDNTVIPVRSGFHYDDTQNGLIEWMPLHKTGDKVMIKVVGYHPKNPLARDLPTILSTISAYDTITGHLMGLVDGVLLTSLRTGAASAVASHYLAHPDSKILGLIGCGAQAITQLHAISRMFRIKNVLIYDTSPSAMSSFSGRASVLGLDFNIVPMDISKVVSLADILVTATTVENGVGPLFKNLETKPYLHVNAVGSDLPGKVELPLDLLEKSFVCPDFPEQALLEGECQQLANHQIGPGWVEIIQNQEDHSNLTSMRTVFDSTGWPLEDLVVMELFLEYGRQLGLGQEVAIELLPQDAKNPYDFLNKANKNGVQKAGFDTVSVPKD